MKFRLTVSGLIKNKEGKYLICKMPEDRGVYPGQWAIPGGGLDEGEKMEEALKREIREEVGLEVEKIKELRFQDDVRIKIKPGKKPEKLYMIHLVFVCAAVSKEVKMNEEFEGYAWVSLDEGLEYDLNEPTRITLELMRKNNG